MSAKVRIGLSGVPETALLTFHSRLNEQGRDNPIISDDVAVRVADNIDYDFSRFGERRVYAGVRARVFDDRIVEFLTAHPSGTVVALAEGLQTTFWRVLDSVEDKDGFRWVTVDLPAMIDVRKKLLPGADQVTVCAQSALDYSWMDRVDSADRVFITAEGLFMYLQKDQVFDLIAACAKRFPGGRLLFDLPPKAFRMFISKKGMRISRGFRTPPMPCALSRKELAQLRVDIPGVRAVRPVMLPDLKDRGWMYRVCYSEKSYRIRPLDALRFSYTIIEF